ncbi:MAG: aldo/keto reductase [Candidatus Aminicenantes bacterium]|nr:aldo/keto reductase [Candidatus Aminicenantes bacterium]
MKDKRSHFSRRIFLQNGIKGVAGAVIIPDLLKSKFYSGDDKTKNKFVYRTLGRTGLKLPVVSIGGPESPVLIETALDRGIIHINTSPEYNKGNQEIMIGKTLRDRPRTSFVIATGFAMWKRPQNQIKNYTKENIIESFEASLKRLQLKYVDIFYLMGVSGRETVLHSPFMEAMESLKKSGKARYVGLTVHQNEPEVLYASIDGKIYDVVLTAYNFRKIYRDEIKSAIAAAVKAGVGIIAMKTQAGVYWNQKTQEMINMKAALKWVLQDKNIHTAVPEFGSIEELYTGISVMEHLELTPEEKKDLRLEGRAPQSGLFCQHCQQCNSQCRGDFDIPTLMRSYMYKYGYHRPLKAKEAIRHIQSSHIICAICSFCSVQCRMGFDVRNRILDVIRLQDTPDDILVSSH